LHKIYPETIIQEKEKELRILERKLTSNGLGASDWTCKNGKSQVLAHAKIK
jgi:hypothetical protein